MVSRRIVRLCAAVAAVSLVALPACQTDDPSVTSNYRSQWSTVSGGPSDVTEAAKDVLEDLQLKEIESSSTNIDGWASGKTADGTKVKVDVKKAGETSSEVSVTVGTMGDPTLGKEILNRLQQRLGT
jgi:hypothetical protein